MSAVNGRIIKDSFAIRCRGSRPSKVHGLEQKTIWQKKLLIIIIFIIRVTSILCPRFGDTHAFAWAGQWTGHNAIRQGSVSRDAGSKIACF